MPPTCDSRFHEQGGITVLKRIPTPTRRAKEKWASACTGQIIFINNREMRRRSRMRGDLKAVTRPVSLLLTLFLHRAPIRAVDADLSIGSVISTDSRYTALQSYKYKRPDADVVDRDGYVSFINDLSNDAFTAFQYNEELVEWGYFPVSEFNQLPNSVQGEFYKSKHAEDR